MKKYEAAFSYRNRDEIESKILSETLVKLVLEVYMPPADFAKMIQEKSGKSFSITL